MSLFVSDSYTEASDTAAASHTPELGGPITLHSFYAPGATVDAATDRLYGTGTTAYYYDATPPSADYYVQAPFFAASLMSANTAICLRVATAADSMILLRLNNGTIWELIERIATSNAVLSSGTTSLPSAGNTTTVRVVVSGMSLTCFFNGVQDTGMNATATTVSAAGKAGIRLSGASSSTTGFHLDSFEAGELITTPDPSFQVRVNRPAMFLPGIPR